MFFSATLCYLHREKYLDFLQTGFDILLSILAAAGWFFYFFQSNILYHSLFFNTALSLAVPILDIGCLVGIVFLIFFTAQKRITWSPTIYIGWALLLWTTADSLFFLNTMTQNTFQKYLDPLWVVGSIFLALAAVQTEVQFANYSKFSLPKPFKPRRRKIAQIIPYLLTCSIVLPLAYQYSLKTPLSIAASLMVFFLIIRQFLVLQKNQQLIELLQKSQATILKDKDQLEKQNEQLIEVSQLREREAHTDFLTHLFNRRHMRFYLEELFLKKTGTHTLSLLLIDIDFFKQINDTYGHQQGDQVLQRVAICIKNLTLGQGTAGRFGGDEFIIALPDVPADEARAFAESLLQLVRNSGFQEPALRITLSIGITTWVGSPQAFQTALVVNQADQALYLAKQQGRNQAAYYQFEK